MRDNSLIVSSLSSPKSSVFWLYIRCSITSRGVGTIRVAKWGLISETWSRWNDQAGLAFYKFCQVAASQSWYYMTSGPPSWVTFMSYMQSQFPFKGRLQVWWCHVASRVAVLTLPVHHSWTLKNVYAIIHCHMPHHVHVDDINGSTALCQLLTFDDMLRCVTPSKLKMGLYCPSFRAFFQNALSAIPQIWLAMPMSSLIIMF